MAGYWPSSLFACLWTETKVQTNCNPQTSLCSCYRTLGFNRCWLGQSYVVESQCSKNCSSTGDSSVLDDIHLLLHQNFLQVALSTDSCS